MKNKKLLLGFLLVLLAPFVTLAADYLPKGQDSGDNVVVSSDTPYRNLYVGGSNVTVNSEVLGDLFVGGGSVNVSAPVEEDLFVAGGNITISSPVSGDARVLGGNVVINAPIAGDLLIAGGTVSLGEGATVGGDLWIAGGNVNLTGVVNGNLKVAGEQIFLNGEVLGKTELTSTDKVTFGPMAVLLGPITYCGDKDPVIETGAQVGTIERKTIGEDSVMNDGFSPMPMLLKTLILLVTLLVIWKLFTSQTTRLVQKTSADFWRNLLWGVISIVVIPVISLLLMFTVFGFALGVIVLLVYFILMIVSCALALLVIGKYAEKLFKQESHDKITPKTILWGVLGSLVLAMVPVVGPVISSAFFMAVFGGMLRILKAKIN
ncbi:MAG: hypothetical protein KBC12_02350 [Candidatus Pacebacteria bacterium]|nr:hypothetical protein [Candidatus Paceibacterota bacterium]